MMDFTYAEAKDLFEFFGELDSDNPEMTITVTEVGSDEPSHSGPGKYAHYTEYPEEGTMLLGEAESTEDNNGTR